jgi:hypothetical protein
MAYRDSRLRSQDRPGNMRAECAVEPGPGVLVYVDDVAAGWCSIAPRASYRRVLNSRTRPQWRSTALGDAQDAVLNCPLRNWMRYR